MQYYRLMEGKRPKFASSVSHDVKGQAVYNGVKTTPS